VQFNVAQLMQEPIGSERSYEIDADVPPLTDEALPSHVAGRARLVRTHRGLLAYGQFDAIARDTCSRCLGPTEAPVRVTFEEEFLPTIDVATGAPLPRPQDDVFTIDEHHELDLTDAVRQALIVAQPMQPLCRPDCAGLCPTCGADRNAGACDCPPDQIDDRWAALARLRDGSG
jgi:uncharacterized protein